MDENEMLTKLALGVTIGVVVFGVIYLYRKSKNSEKDKSKNKVFSPVSFSNEAKEKITSYFEKLKDEENSYYKRNYLNFYFDLNLSEDETSKVKTGRISGSYELGLSFDEAQLAYGYIKSALLKSLKLHNDLSNSDTFILALDYFSYLGRKEAFDEVSNEFNLKVKFPDKYNKVTEQLDKEFESLKQS